MYTTITCARGEEYSYISLVEMLCNAVYEDQDVDEVAEELIKRVNDRLPGSFLWLPHISEMYCDIDEEEELGDLDEIIEKVWREIEQEYLND